MDTENSTIWTMLPRPLLAAVTVVAMFLVIVLPLGAFVLIYHPG